MNKIKQIARSLLAFWKSASWQFKFSLFLIAAFCFVGFMAFLFKYYPLFFAMIFFPVFAEIAKTNR